jgi:hypothetical protein
MCLVLNIYRLIFQIYIQIVLVSCKYYLVINRSSLTFWSMYTHWKKSIAPLTLRPVIDCRMCRIIVDMTLNPTLRHKLSLVDTIRHISIVVKTSEAPFWIDWLSFKIYIAPSLGHDIAKKSNCRRRYWLQPCDFTVFTSVYRIKMAIADQTELI